MRVLYPPYIPWGKEKKKASALIPIYYFSFTPKNLSI